MISYKRPLQFIDGLADRLSAALGALALSQFPQFYGQYMQRLGGHLDEARLMLVQYEKAASLLSLSLDQYIKEHLEAQSEVFVSTGEVILSLVERYESLEKAYQALREASIYNRWVVFLQEVDWQVAAKTWENFVPGMPTTLEGLIYGLSGLLLGWAFYSALKAVPAFFTRSYRRGRPGRLGERDKRARPKGRDDQKKWPDKKEDQFSD